MKATKKHVTFAAVGAFALLTAFGAQARDGGFDGGTGTKCNTDGCVTGTTTVNNAGGQGGEGGKGGEANANANATAHSASSASAQGGSSQSNNSNANNYKSTSNNSFVAVPAPGTAVDGCTATTGSSAGVSVFGFGIGGAHNSVDKEHFKNCMDRVEPLKFTESQSACLRAFGLAGTSLQNPYLAKVLATPQGQDMYATMVIQCTGKAVASRAPKHGG